MVPPCYYFYPCITFVFWENRELCFYETPSVVFRNCMGANKNSTKSTGVFPLLPMSAMALASFMDSFCYQIIVPNLPFAVQKWFPEVLI